MIITRTRISGIYMILHILKTKLWLIERAMLLGALWRLTCSWDGNGMRNHKQHWKNKKEWSIPTETVRIRSIVNLIRTVTVQIRSIADLIRTVTVQINGANKIGNWYENIQYSIFPPWHEICPISLLEIQMNVPRAYFIELKKLGLSNLIIQV